jgi:HTH-type transcriptional regulator / antitoxin HipB
MKGKIEMDDLDRTIEKLKKRSPYIAENFDKGYEEFKVGVMLKMARKKAGLSQIDIANKLHTNKSAISRIENHAEDIKLSTLEKYAHALNKHLTINFV